MPPESLLTEAEAEEALLDYLSEINGTVPLWQVMNRLGEIGTRSENRETRKVLRNKLTELIQSGVVRRYHRRWQYHTARGRPRLGWPRFRVDLTDEIRISERARRAST